MTSLHWIESAGGPLILISDFARPFWSGINNRQAYLNNQLEEEDDFMNPDLTDYGKAGSINDYLGVIDINNESALILADMPLSTAIFFTDVKEVAIARWLYGPDTNIVDELLSILDLNTIKNWEYAEAICLEGSEQYIFDSAINGKEMKSKEYLSLNLPAGNYEVFTNHFQPTEEISLLLHRIK